MTEPGKRTQLLPGAFTRPSFLIWVMILPQLLLLFLNFRGWDLARTEMSPEQRGMALTIFVYEVGLLFLGSIVLGFLLWMKRTMSVWFCAGMLLLHIGYLWMVTAWIDQLLPNTISVWMLTQGQVMLYQYALMMPAVFYAGLRLSCFQMRVRKGADVGITLAGLVLIPVAWYILIHASFFLFKWAEPPFAVLLILIVGSTVTVLVAFLRMLMHLYNWLRRCGKAWFVLPALAGLAFIGGLVLNRSIKFPYDFQHPYVYVLAVANLAVLLLRFRMGTGLGTLGWVLRAVLFPFTLYFFIVFLPFLPLSLVAMLAFGAGVLMLSPTLAFDVLHRVEMNTALAPHREDGNNIRMVKLRRCSGFVFESRNLFLVQESRERKHLQRHTTVERHLLGFVNDSHPTAADLTENREVPQPLFGTIGG